MSKRKRYKGVCLNCGIYYEGEGKKYCSHKCSVIFNNNKYVRQPKKIKICEYCKSEFLANKKKKFCSLECYHKSAIKFKNKKECRKASLITHKYCNIKIRAKKLNIPNVEKEEIISWYNSQEKKCFYCDIPYEIWEFLYKGFQNKYSLTFDRKNNDFGYTSDNLVLACGQCNSVKSNILDSNEMKEIADKYIKPKWQKKIMEVYPNGFIQTK